MHRAIQTFFLSRCSVLYSICYINRIRFLLHVQSNQGTSKPLFCFCYCLILLFVQLAYKLRELFRIWKHTGQKLLGRFSYVAAGTKGNILPVVERTIGVFNTVFGMGGVRCLGWGDFPGAVLYPHCC